jgi:hypothetical protein
MLENAWFEHGQWELYAALEAGQAISHRFVRDDKSWRVFASAERVDSRAKPDFLLGAVGVDINADHLAVADVAPMPPCKGPLDYCAGRGVGASPSRRLTRSVRCRRGAIPPLESSAQPFGWRRWNRCPLNLNGERRFGSSEAGPGDHDHATGAHRGHLRRLRAALPERYRC